MNTPDDNDRPPISAQADAEKLLIEFLRDRDAPCPHCGYNLRSLTRQTCPECHKEVGLTVGPRAPLHRILALLVAAMPGFFSGICASLMVLAQGAALVMGNGLMPMPWMGIVAFGLLSGVASCLLVAESYHFLRRPERLQWTLAVAVWLVHLGAFVVMVFILN